VTLLIEGMEITSDPSDGTATSSAEQSNERAGYIYSRKFLNYLSTC
jgi:hypothetical protein